MTTPSFNQDIISEIFGEQPKLSFLGYLGNAKLPKSMEEFFRSRASDFLEQYQQAVGQQLASGKLPTLTPESYFGGLNFRNEALKFSPETRGMGTSQFFGRTRFI